MCMQIQNLMKENMYCSLYETDPYCHKKEKSVLYFIISKEYFHFYWSAQWKVREPWGVWKPTLCLTEIDWGHQKKYFGILAIAEFLKITEL